MSYTLLLADDSATIRRVIELTFADEEIQVIAVGGGQEAIDRIKADPPDIVLADTSMAERDGYDVATFIKGNPGLAHIPVVLLTVAFEPVEGDRARQACCDAVLVKPFAPQAVIRCVRELLDGRPAVTDALAIASDDPRGDGPPRPVDAEGASRPPREPVSTTPPSPEPVVPPPPQPASAHNEDAPPRDRRPSRHGDPQWSEGENERRAARRVWGGSFFVAGTLLLLGWWLSSRTRR